MACWKTACNNRFADNYTSETSTINCNEISITDIKAAEDTFSCQKKTWYTLCIIQTKQPPTRRGLLIRHSIATIILEHRFCRLFQENRFCFILFSVNGKRKLYLMQKPQQSQNMYRKQTLICTKYSRAYDDVCQREKWFIWNRVFYSCPNSYKSPHSLDRSLFVLQSYTD